jgi:hypothetical protein
MDCDVAVLLAMTGLGESTAWNLLFDSPHKKMDCHVAMLLAMTGVKATAILLKQVQNL